MIYLQLLTALSTMFSMIALAVAVRASMIRTVPRRRLERIEQGYDDLEHRHASLHKSFKRMNSRVAMREARAKKADLDNVGDAENQQALPLTAVDSLDQLPGETPNQWKLRVRHLIASGKVRPQSA